MPERSAPYVRDAIGALFEMTTDAVVIAEGDQVVAWNSAAETLFGVPADRACAAGALPLGEDHAGLLALEDGSPAVRMVLHAGAVVDAMRRVVDGRHVLMLRDLSSDLRRAEGHRRIAEFTRGLLSLVTSRSFGGVAGL